MHKKWEYPILYGAAYYDEYMPIDHLKEDVRLMKEAGLNVVRISESTWSVIEPRDAEFDFRRLDLVIDAMEEAGIRVIIGTPSYSLPPWLAKMHPNMVIGGWERYGYRANMNIRDTDYRFYVERMVRKLVEHVRDRKSVIGYQVDNETKSNGTNTPEVRELFVKELRNRYESIGNLNTSWGLNYWGQNVTSWDELSNPESASNPGYRFAWLKFQKSLVTEFLNWQSTIVRELKTSRQFITHNFDLEDGGPHSLVDQFSTTKVFDIAGVDVYYPSQNSFDGASIAFGGDYGRSLLQQNHLVLETTAQTNGWDSQRQYPPLDGQVRQAVYSHLASGANMVEYWHWHSLHFGQEMYWRGVLGQDLQPNRVYFEVKRTGLELKNIQDSINSLSPENRVAILFSPDSQSALKIHPFDSTVNYNVVFRSLYDSLYKINVGVDIVTPESDWSKYRLLVVPPLYICSDALASKLKSFHERGGGLIFSFKSGFCDENAQARHATAPGPLSALCGVTYQEFSSSGKVGLTSTSETLGLEQGGASTWVEYLKLGTARSLLQYTDSTFSSYPAVTVEDHGPAPVIYQGTHLEAHTQEKVFEWMLRKLNIVDKGQSLRFPAIVRSGRNSRGDAVHYLFNYSGKNVRIKYPFGRSLDIIKRTETLADQMVELEPWDVQIFMEY